MPDVHTKWKISERIITLAAALVLTIAGCTLSGCAAQKKTTILPNQIIKIIGERPPLDKDLAMLVPGGLQGAIWVNFKDLRKSPLWPTVETVLETYYSDQLFSRQFILYILRHLDEMLAVSGHRTEAKRDGFATIIKGNWDSTDVLKRLLSEGSFKQTTVQGRETLQMANVTVLKITKQSILIVSDSLLEDVAPLLDLKGNSLRNDTDFNDMEKPDKGGAAFHYIRNDSKLRIPDLPILPPRYVRYARYVQTVNGNLTMTKSFNLKADIEMDAPEQAAQVKSNFDRELKAITSNALVAMLGVKPLVKKLKLTSKGNLLRVNMDLSKTDVDKILQLVEPIMQLRKMIE